VFLPDEQQQRRIAWVESTGQEGLDWEIGNSKYFRSLGFPWGGLYVRARDVLTFVSAFLPGKDSKALSRAARTAMVSQQVAPPEAPASVAPAQRDVTWDPTRPPRARVPWGLGWEVRGGEASDYIPEIIFTALIVRRSWANGARETLHTFLRILHEATGILHDPASDDTLLTITCEIAQAEGGYARKALDYMRIKQVFTSDLSISEAAFAKTLELMQKAGVIDATIATRAHTVLDDSYRHEALARA